MRLSEVQAFANTQAIAEQFQCADLICDFCWYLAQVRASTVRDHELIPASILGAAWGPQKDRMAAAIYFPLFLILVSGNKHAIYYLAADLQKPETFKPRKPLPQEARRAGWRGFVYNLKGFSESFVRLD